MRWVLHAAPARRVVVRKPVRKPRPIVRPTVSRSAVRVAVPVGNPQQIAADMLAARGESSQLGCLVAMWNRESGWRVTAQNPGSGAYGIPQALPGSKMAAAGADWQTSAATQIRWGLTYIASRYGTPCNAWSVWQSRGWY
jgi:resuscitation-promoting factor RpfB